MCQSLCVTADGLWAPEKAGNGRHCAYTLMLTHNGSFQKEKRLQENWVVFPIHFPFADAGRVLEREGPWSLGGSVSRPLSLRAHFSTWGSAPAGSASWLRAHSAVP